MGADQYQPIAAATAAVNAVCPYFTMFPLEFPYKVLSREGNNYARVLDPFCGRGTTNLAARLLGMSTVGIDSNSLAVALTQAKLIKTSPQAILTELAQILEESSTAVDIPSGEFWELAFERSTLESLARIRSALIQDCHSPERIGLRAILLGALHGPKTKGDPSYLSNQSPRTYAPKPRYAVSFWRNRALRPDQVDVTSLVSRRAHRYYSQPLAQVEYLALLGDSRDATLFADTLDHHRFDWVITSPPYYGLRTYNPDQWLRLWFLGGSATVDYSQQGQMMHESKESFAQQLSEVWRNCASVCNHGARLVVRFGRIADRPVDALGLLRESLTGTGWRIQTRKNAGSAALGKRQAEHFGIKSTAQQEIDLWAVKVSS